MAEPIGPLDVAARQMRVEATQMQPPRPTTAPMAGEGGPSFREMLQDAVSQVQQLRSEADDTVRKVVSGEIADVAEAMVAVQRADLAFQTMMTVRGRVMTAYEEIMRMQV